MDEALYANLLVQLGIAIAKLCSLEEWNCFIDDSFKVDRAADTIDLEFYQVDGFVKVRHLRVRLSGLLRYFQENSDEETVPSFPSLVRRPINDQLQIAMRNGSTHTSPLVLTAQTLYGI